MVEELTTALYKVAKSLDGIRIMLVCIMFVIFLINMGRK